MDCDGETRLGQNLWAQNQGSHGHPEQDNSEVLAAIKYASDLEGKLRRDIDGLQAHLSEGQHKGLEGSVEFGECEGTAMRYFKN